MLLRCLDLRNSDWWLVFGGVCQCQWNKINFTFFCLKLKAKSTKFFPRIFKLSIIWFTFNETKNGAKASDSEEKTYSPVESEALAPKKEQNPYFIGIGGVCRVNVISLSIFLAFGFYETRTRSRRRV